MTIVRILAFSSEGELSAVAREDWAGQWLTAECKAKVVTTAVWERGESGTVSHTLGWGVEWGASLQTLNSYNTAPSSHSQSATF